MDATNKHAQDVPLEYRSPSIVDYGDLVELTAKPGSRCDGFSGTQGDKGVGIGGGGCTSSP